MTPYCCAFSKRSSLKRIESFLMYYGIQIIDKYDKICINFTLLYISFATDLYSWIDSIQILINKNDDESPVGECSVYWKYRMIWGYYFYPVDVHGSTLLSLFDFCSIFRLRFFLNLICLLNLFKIYIIDKQLFPNVTYQMILITEFVLTWAKRRVSLVACRAGCAFLSREPDITLSFY